MANFFMVIFSLDVVWSVQFACAVIVALILPRDQWRLKVLCGLSATADIVEALLFSGTRTYFCVYWIFRMVELNWLLYATCSFCIPRIYGAFRQGLWLFMLVGLVSTAAIIPPVTTDGMQIWQVFMLMLAALVAVGAYFIYCGLKWGLIALAMGLLSIMQLACTMLWRHWRYDTHMWMIAWITGMLLLWMAGREDRARSQSSP